MLVYVAAISLMSNIQPTVDTVSMENESTIAAMECLLNHCTSGRQTCVRILTAFKIAAVSRHFNLYFILPSLLYLAELGHVYLSLRYVWYTFVMVCLILQGLERYSENKKRELYVSYLGLHYTEQLLIYIYVVF